MQLFHTSSFSLCWEPSPGEGESRQLVQGLPLWVYFVGKSNWRCCSAKKVLAKSVCTCVHQNAKKSPKKKKWPCLLLLKRCSLVGGYLNSYHLQECSGMKGASKTHRTQSVKSVTFPGVVQCSRTCRSRESTVQGLMYPGDDPNSDAQIKKWL